MFRTESEWIGEYASLGALWIHNKDKKRPHALLASGNHSNGFFNSRLVIAHDGLLSEAASDLLDLFCRLNGDLSTVHGVVGPQTGATRLSELMSTQIAIRTGSSCFSASPAKSEDGGKKSMVFNRRDLDMVHASSVLLCEDVLTTGGSVELAADAVTRAAGKLLPYILVLVNRSGLKEIGGREIVSLIHRDMPIWTPDECPLCRDGSEVLRPKDNWDRLTVSS